MNRDPELAKGWVQIVHTLAVDTAGSSQNLTWLVIKAPSKT